MRKADRENEAVHLLAKLTNAALSQNKYIIMYMYF